MKFRFTTLLSIAALLCSNVNAKLTESEKGILLNLHRDARNAVGASNMKPLSWSDKLAADAEEYATKCSGSTHSKPSARGKHIGENMSHGKDTVKNLFKLWTDERDDFLDSGNINHFKGVYYHGKKIGHYSQVVWAKNTEVGCGVHDCGGGHLQLICRYGCGNVIGQSVYEGVNHETKPKHEEPKHEEPKHEEPKVEKPKHEEPKHEEPKHESKPTTTARKTTTTTRRTTTTTTVRKTTTTTTNKPTTTVRKTTTTTTNKPTTTSEKTTTTTTTTTTTIKVPVTTKAPVVPPVITKVAHTTTLKAPILTTTRLPLLTTILPTTKAIGAVTTVTPLAIPVSTTTNIVVAPVVTPINPAKKPVNAATEKSNDQKTAPKTAPKIEEEKKSPSVNNDVQQEDKNEKPNTSGSNVATGVAVTGSLLGAAAAFAFVKKNPKQYQNIKRNITRGATTVKRNASTLSRKLTTSRRTAPAPSNVNYEYHYRADLANILDA